MEKYIGEIIVIILIIGTTLLKDFYKWYKSSGKLRFFNQNIELDVNIKEELKFIVNKFGFNRVSIVKYHNGTESFDGFSFNYATITHEEVDDITVGIISEFQKIPLTSFSEVLKDIKDSPNKYNVLDSDSTHSGIMQAGWNVIQSWNFMLSDRISDGIICCAMTQIPNSLSEADIREIKSVVYKVNLLLNKRK